MNYIVYDRVQASRGADYIFVYSSTGKPFTLNLGKISGQRLQAYWYDPRTGQSKEPLTVENNGSKKFIPPSSGYGQDWILVVDDLSAKYPKL